MASQELSARLKYLDEAAHLLAPTASAASKHMMLQYNSLLFDATDPHKPLKNKNACGACGTIMILGWEAAMAPSIPRSRRNGKSNGNGNGSKSKAISYKCQSCHRITRHPILNRQRRQKPAPKSSSSAHTLTPISSSNLQPKTNLSATAASSANSNSKKRAKSRKQGGLQAILAKKNSTEAASSGFGLDLLDFMKK
ncbi:hypothetical protein HYFRA_00001148 [Hymenoscyphus fraxineus]|uniref:Uncharacterized protein n=1 Tax=Hymenoscyphus fraxineus TaxID=746836 RepID=A0A9N9PMI7_9HELO|nr:hypothetical protein HYFRA_00001148 [Hymenoscyphus fraxineus]